MFSLNFRAARKFILAIKMEMKFATKLRLYIQDTTNSRLETKLNRTFKPRLKFGHKIRLDILYNFKLKLASSYSPEFNLFLIFPNSRTNNWLLIISINFKLELKLPLKTKLVTLVINFHRLNWLPTSKPKELKFSHICKLYSLQSVKKLLPTPKIFLNPLEQVC